MFLTPGQDRGLFLFFCSVHIDDDYEQRGAFLLMSYAIADERRKLLEILIKSSSRARYRGEAYKKACLRIVYGNSS